MKFSDLPLDSQSDPICPACGGKRLNVVWPVKGMLECNEVFVDEDQWFTHIDELGVPDEQIEVWCAKCGDVDGVDQSLVWVYAVECRDGHVYGGSTTDLINRLTNHVVANGSKMTRKHGGVYDILYLRQVWVPTSVIAQGTKAVNDWLVSTEKSLEQWARRHTRDELRQMCGQNAYIEDVLQPAITADIGYRVQMGKPPFNNSGRSRLPLFTWFNSGCDLSGQPSVGPFPVRWL
jgi:predicted GIY-YIG superfamily endonuclease